MVLKHSESHRIVKVETIREGKTLRYQPASHYAPWRGSQCLKTKMLWKRVNRSLHAIGMKRNTFKLTFTENWFIVNSIYEQRLCVCKGVRPGVKLNKGMGYRCPALTNTVCVENAVRRRKPVIGATWEGRAALAWDVSRETCCFYIGTLL